MTRDAHELSPDELATVLGAVRRGLADPVGAAPQPRDVQPLDLTRVERSVGGQLPGLRVVMERLAHEAAGALAPFVGVMPVVSASPIAVESHGVLRARGDGTTGWVGFRLPPLAGDGRIGVDGPLLASVLETVFGGTPGRVTPREAKEPSPIERRVLARVGRALLEALREAWRPFLAVTPALVTDDGDAVVGNGADRCVVATLDVRGDAGPLGTVTIAMDERGLDAVRDVLRRPQSVRGAADASDGAWSTRLRDAIARAPVDVSAELGCRPMRLREVLALDVGDVLTLPTSRDAPVVVCVGGHPFFAGTPGVSSGQTAVRITAHEEDA